MAFLAVAGPSAARSAEVYGAALDLAANACGAAPAHCFLGTADGDRSCAAAQSSDGRLRLAGRLRLIQKEALSAGAAVLAGDPATTLLDAWSREGAAVLRRLRGAFAFAVWDDAEQVLTVVRDQMGQRPLYYQRTPEGDLIASDNPELVLAWPGTSTEVDVEAVVAQCLGYRRLLKTRTTYAAVSRLPAGHVLTWRDGRIGLRRYWQPEIEPSKLSARALAEELRSRVTESVRDSLTPDARVGAHVSGGLDSSAVAALGHRALGGTGSRLVQAFSWSPPPDTRSPSDERGRTLELLEPMGVPISWTSLDAAGLRRTMSLGLEPASSSGLVHESWVAAEAAAAGVDVVLSGWGGDEFASFNRRGALSGAVRSGHLAVATAFCYGRGRRGGATGLRAAVRTGKHLWRYGVRPAMHLPSGSPEDKESPAAIHREVLRRLHPSAPDMLDEQERRLTQVGSVATQLALLDNGHLKHRMGAWAHLGDQHGFEYRYPLLDLRVVELALTVPDVTHLHAPMPRWLFRTAMSPYLPHDLCWGEEKDEPAKRDAQLEVLSEVAPVRPEGPAEAADIVERYYELRRELHQRLRGRL